MERKSPTLTPLSFDEAVSDLLKVKPLPKAGKKEGKPKKKPAK